MYSKINKNKFLAYIKKQYTHNKTKILFRNTTEPTNREMQERGVAPRHLYDL